MQPVKFIGIVLGSAMMGALAFVGFPWLDFTVSGWFYDSVRGFWLAGTGPVLWVYRGLVYCVWGFSAVLVTGLAWAHVSSSERARKSRRPLWFLLLVLGLGPGLFTHLVLKDHWGCPRPEAITEFGGAGHYVMPGVISDQCDTNCSFVSGHAAAGFFIIAFGWVFPLQRRRWRVAGILAGSVVGLVRIIQGGHFFSDIFFSYWVVWLTATAVWTLMAKYVPEKPFLA